MVNLTISTRLKITASGQMSLPAEVRRRWATPYVTAEDRGDHMILRPASDEPLDEVFAIFAAEAAGTETTVDEIRADERAAEREAETVWR